MSNLTRPTPMTAHPSPALQGHARPPGDKSISHRALIFGALAVGRTTIEGLLEGEDVLNTARSLRLLGADIQKSGRPGEWVIQGVGVGGFREPDQVLDHGNSGTGVRLMMGAVATTPIAATFTGDASLNRRPMGRVLEPLSLFGTSTLGRAGQLLPLTLQGVQARRPAEFTMTVPSAQVKSAFLLAALNAPGRSRLIEREATRDHTEKMLKAFGADVSVALDSDGRSVIDLVGQPELRPRHVVVPADPSSAAFIVVAALLTPGSKVTISNVLMSPTRSGLYATLQEMGARLTIRDLREEGGEPIGTIDAEYSDLTAIRVPADRAPSMIDEYPILSIAAANAIGRMRMEGLAELRVKESDRLAAVEAGLTAIGVRCAADKDTLEVNGCGPGAVPGGGLVRTQMDHRIAMAFLIAGLSARAAVPVDDTSMIATSFPEFVPLMRRLGARIEAAPA